MAAEGERVNNVGFRDIRGIDIGEKKERIQKKSGGVECGQLCGGRPVGERKERRWDIVEERS